MINTFVLARSSSLLRSFSKSQFDAVIQRLSSFTSRHILQERNDQSGTLLTRFTKHVAIELQKDTPIVPTSIRYSDFFPITDIRYLRNELARITSDQLPALIIFAFTYRANADPQKYASLLNELDARALHLLPNMDMDTILRTLYAFLYLMPNWIMQIDFYNAAMKRLTTNEFVETITKDKFVQICFYLGFNKSRDVQLVGTFKKFLNRHIDSHLPNLITLDFVVIANAAFKTSIRVESELYNERLNEELKKLSLNEATNDPLLISLIKSIRLQRIQSEQVCEHLKKLCTHDIFERIQLRGCMHLFAYFADNHWDDNTAIERLVEHCLQRLQSPKRFDTLANEEVRCKELATFLWCCAQLNYKISENDLKRIELMILNKINQNEFQYFVDQLVDSCLSLWTLGHKSRDLIEATIDLKLRPQYNNKNDQREKPKVESRFEVLLAAIAIEEPTWNLKKLKISPTQKVDTPAPAYLLKSRSDFAEISNKISEHPNVNSVDLVCPIFGINIPSILVSYKGPDNVKMFIELLSDEQELKCSKSPIGLMRLKIRLLKSMGYKVNILPMADYESNTNSLDELLNNVESDDVAKAQSLNI
ncbi:uncharacterized protein [Eurosta solidaginis]|uniref:uncharacterized protein n=1 Tax=Eurosta solidaginis TaxID=178769 RepID=UPI003530689A